MQEFKSGVAEKLRHYVYRLVDPRNGRTFYIGRGQGNRIFAHVSDELRLENEEAEKSAKLGTIREIRRAGLEITHIIHRHKLSEAAAKEVEAALIDYTPGLDNIASGSGKKRGPANAIELDRLYARETMEPDPSHKLLYLKTSDDAMNEQNGNIYEAARQAWVVDLGKAKCADYVIAAIKNVCHGVFKPNRWQFHPGHDPDRYGFDGEEVSGQVADAYVHKLIPEDMRRGRNPVRYGY